MSDDHALMARILREIAAAADARSSTHLGDFRGPCFAQSLQRRARELEKIGAEVDAAVERAKSAA